MDGSLYLETIRLVNTEDDNELNDRSISKIVHSAIAAIIYGVHTWYMSILVNQIRV